jgi:phosphate acetyltransferase
MRVFHSARVAERFALIVPVLVGPEARNREVAEENRLDLKAHEIVDVEA